MKENNFNNQLFYLVKLLTKGDGMPMKIFGSKNINKLIKYY